MLTREGGELLLQALNQREARYKAGAAALPALEEEEERVRSSGDEEGWADGRRVRECCFLLRVAERTLIRDVRGKGLWVGLDIDPAKARARTVCEHLMTEGVLSKETHETVVRFAPPLVITRAEIDFAIERITAVLAHMVVAAEV